MKDFDTAIDAVRLAIATAEALSNAMDKAKSALDSGAEQLKKVLAEIEKERGAMHDQLARDRKEARDDFDKKFDHHVEPDETDEPVKSDDEPDDEPDGNTNP